MGFEDGAMVESSNSCWSARGLALSADVLWFGNGETRIVAGSLALSVVEADEIGRFNGAAIVVFLEFLASSGVFLLVLCVEPNGCWPTG